ncbi:MAG: hypothetical protein M1835_002454, partial [Candelina submexicana]
MASSQPPTSNVPDFKAPAVGSSSAPWSQTHLHLYSLTKSSNTDNALAPMPPPVPPHISSSQESHSTDTSSNNNSFTRLPPYSQSTLVETESTPPTSSDGPSDQSQESQLSRFAYRSTAQQGPLDCARPRTPPIYARTSDLPARLERRSTPVSPASVTFQSGVLNQGHKRTANGDLKPESASLPGSPISVIPKHSRNMSIDSGGSNISELSSQLRARLSYAMVKVQNGWQGRSLDEVENLTSPTASASKPHGALRCALGPPPTLPASLRREGSDASRTSSGTPSPSKKLAIPRGHSRNHTSDLSSAFTLSPPQRHPTAGNLTYESFWQNHATPNPVSQYLQTRTTTTDRPYATPSLAPAAPIVARPHPRRSNSRTIQPTMLSALSTSKDNKVSDLSETSTIPNTPPPSSQPRTPVVRTPSQKTAMEKDAVETLLFMSSPGNSDYHPPREMPGTPLRTATKKVEFVDGVGTSSEDDDLSTGNVMKQGLSDEDDMDRMLDGMEDDSSDDEIE